MANPIVTITMENGDMIKAELYPDIAKITGTTSSGVERCIRYARKKAIAQDHGEIYETIGVSPYTTNLSNAQFLHCIAYRMTQKEREENL